MWKNGKSKMTKKLYTWIDQDLCTGDGLCEEVCPDIFYGHDDGLFYVKEPTWKTGLDESGNPRLKMAQGLASVPAHLIDSAVEAAEECPGECIFFTEIDEDE
jgi:ferredoxin